MILSEKNGDFSRVFSMFSEICRFLVVVNFMAFQR